MLKRLEQSAWRRSLSHYDPFAPVTAWDLGRVSEAASAADDAIFHVLATARANCHVKMTDAQLFGPDPAREQEPDEPQVHLDVTPGVAPALDDEPAVVEPPAVTDDEPPTERNSAPDASRPRRRPIHAV